MFLKISDGDGGWTLLDNVTQAHVLPKVISVSDQNELVGVEGENALILISRDCFKKKQEVQVGVIEFIRNEMVRRALFTNIVYVCDDKGNTLDRHSVGIKGRKGVEE